MTEHQRRIARCIMIALPVAFGLQLAFVALVSEPYPALMMPGFGWAGPVEGAVLDISLPEVVFTRRDGSLRQVSQSELLSGIPDGHHSTIMYNVFSSAANAPSSRGPQGKREAPSWLFPGYGLARVAREQPEHVCSLAAWLRQRARELDAAGSVRCEVRWLVDSYRTEGPGSSVVRARRVEMGRLEIELEAPCGR